VLCTTVVHIDAHSPHIHEQFLKTSVGLGRLSLCAFRFGDF